MASRLILAALALRRLGSRHSHAKFPFPRITSIGCFIVIWLATTVRLELDQAHCAVCAQSVSFMREGLNCIVRLAGSRTEPASECKACPSCSCDRGTQNLARACAQRISSESLSHPRCRCTTSISLSLSDTVSTVQTLYYLLWSGKVFLFLTLASDAARPVRIL